MVDDAVFEYIKKIYKSNVMFLTTHLAPNVMIENI